jgi:hypothetical protein
VITTVSEQPVISSFYLEDGRDTFLPNIGKLKQEYTAS